MLDIEREMGFPEGPQDACGVFGIYGPDLPVPRLAYKGAMAIQHRGQQGAGISTSNGEDFESLGIAIINGPGLFKEVFDHGKGLRSLHTNEEALVATSQAWYATAGTEDSQVGEALMPMPYSGEGAYPKFTFSLNGDVKDLSEAADIWLVDVEDVASDGVGIKEIVGAAYEKYGNLEDALASTLPHMEGAFSLVLSTTDELVGARDPWGFRPLHLGLVEDGDEGEQKGWVLSSEAAALRVVGAKLVREVKPGEIVTIHGATGDEEQDISSRMFVEEEDLPNPMTCLFEFIYFSRPDQKIHGQSVNSSRMLMGEILAARDPVPAEEIDFVVAVPNSGRVAAKGYAYARGLPEAEGIVKNEYVDRSFIEGEQDDRAAKVRNKLLPDPEIVDGKNLVIVDDSVVRGTTQKELVSMLRKAGANKIHLRLTSDKYAWPCFMGMDTGRPDELIANRFETVEEIREYLGVDTLEYMSVDELKTAVDKAADFVCTACMTGDYPIEVPVNLRSKAA